MTKGLQLWPGDRMRTFFRRHILRETSLDAQTVERLVEALTASTNRMLVWEMPADAKAPPAAQPATTSAKTEKRSADKGKAAAGKPLPEEPRASPAADAPFDPYAFSAMVVLAKQGKDALAKRLAEIKSVDNLKKLGDAQHLGFDRSLSKIEDVRKALLAAAEQRLADRRAAAS